MGGTFTRTSSVQQVQVILSEINYIASAKPLCIYRKKHEFFFDQFFFLNKGKM